MPSLWAPLPPTKSAITTYVEAMYLRTDIFRDLNIVSADSRRSPLPHALPPDADNARDPERLLQIGNGAGLDYIYQHAYSPGAILELHDLSLHPLHRHATLNRGDHSAYRDVLIDCEGAWGRRLADQRAKGYVAPNLEYHARVNQIVTDRARAIIVHSHWAKMQLELQDCQTPVHVIPRYAPRPDQSPARALDRMQARALLGIPDDAFVILSAGTVRRTKRLDWIIDAFDVLAAEQPNTMLIVVGDCRLPSIAAQIALSPWSDQIRTTGYVPDADFCDYMLAADIVPVMRYPSSGETSGVAALAAGFGRLVVVPELMAFSDIEDRYCEKILLDSDPVEQLIAIFERWFHDIDGLRQKEAQIADHARTHLAIEDRRRDIASILDRYWS